MPPCSSKLELKRLGAGQVALANEALVHRQGELLERPDLKWPWAGAGDGPARGTGNDYGETALWFERAGNWRGGAMPKSF